MGLEIFYTSCSRWKKKLHFGPVFFFFANIHNRNAAMGYSYFMPLPPSADVDLQLVVRESDGAVPCSVCRGDKLYTFVHVCTQEAYIAELDAKSGASLKLTILNAKGRIWTMVAGGGASVIYAWVTPPSHPLPTSSPPLPPPHPLHILPPPWTYHLPTTHTIHSLPPIPHSHHPLTPYPHLLPPSTHPLHAKCIAGVCVCVCVCVN